MIVVAKFGSLFSAAASSFNWSSVSGVLPTSAATTARTNAVVAIRVVFVPGTAVGAEGVPVKTGETSGAFSARPAVTVAA